MDRPNTIAGLLEKHASLQGQIDAARRHLGSLIADLEAVERTLRLFDPEAELPRAKPVRTHDAAFKGEMRGHVMAALRGATGPITSLEIARYVAQARGLEPAQDVLVRLRKRVSACLYKLRQRGLVEEVPKTGEYKGWRLTSAFRDSGRAHEVA
ncbi:MAG: hypothetical protein H6923_07320 [Alphaproteobacteria bacterium]|nr:hypothetical protein [Alphaproteobacteria bacterium]